MEFSIDSETSVAPAVNLRVANAERAAVKARDLYLSLLSSGWEETLKRFKAGYAEPDRIDLSIGEYVEAVKAETSIRPQTVEGLGQSAA